MKQLVDGTDGKRAQFTWRNEAKWMCTGKQERRVACVEYFNMQIQMHVYINYGATQFMQGMCSVSNM